jgi:O-antigen ligase
MSVMAEKQNTRREETIEVDAEVPLVGELKAGPLGPGVGGRLTRVLDPGIFLLLLVIVSSVIIPHPRFELWWELTFTPLIFSLYALRLLEVTLTGNWRIKCLDLLTPLLLLSLFSLVQTLPLNNPQNGIVAGGLNAWWAISADPYETRRFAIRLLAFVLTGDLLWRYASSQRRLQALAHVAIFVGVGSAVCLMVQKWMQHGLSAQLRARLWQFGNPNHFAFLMEMTLGLLLGLMLGGGVRRNRLLVYAAMSLWVWAGLVLTNSRGGIIAMFGELLAVGALFPGVRFSRTAPDEWSGQSMMWRIVQSRLLRAFLVATLLIVVAIGIVWQGGDSLTRRLETVSNEINVSDVSGDNSLGKVRRSNIWLATWQLFKAHPIVGSGFGGYWIAISEYYDAPGEVVPYQADNDYLELLASGGIIGTLLVAWFLFVLIRRVTRELRSDNSFQRSLCLGALAGILAVAIHSTFDFGLHNNFNALLLIVLIVLATANQYGGKAVNA